MKKVHSVVKEIDDFFYHTRYVHAYLSFRFKIYHLINLQHNHRRPRKRRNYICLKTLKYCVVNLLFLPYFIKKKYVLFIEHTTRKNLDSSISDDIFLNSYKLYYKKRGFKIISLTNSFRLSSSSEFVVMRIYYDIFLYFCSLIPLRSKNFNIIRALENITSINSRILKRLTSRYYLSIEILSRFFNFYKPEALFTVEYYNSNNLILSAINKLDINTYEVQHGIINNHHYGYNFPYSIKSDSLPNYILFWGRFWIDNLNYKQNFIPKLSFFEFFIKQKICNKMRYRDSILIISQPSISLYLKQIIKTVKKNKKIKRISVKVHPSELKLSDDFSNINIYYNQNIYELINKYTFILGCYSTALFEAVAFGKKVFYFNIKEFDHYIYILEKAGIINFDLFHNYNHNCHVKSKYLFNDINLIDL